MQAESVDDSSQYFSLLAERSAVLGRSEFVRRRAGFGDGTLNDEVWVECFGLECLRARILQCQGDDCLATLSARPNHSTYSAPFITRSPMLVPRPVRAARPPKAIAIAVRIADLPPGHQHSSCHRNDGTHFHCDRLESSFWAQSRQSSDDDT
jgi:hypothetical protein